MLFEEKGRAMGNEAGMASSVLSSKNSACARLYFVLHFFGNNDIFNCVFLSYLVTCYFTYTFLLMFKREVC